MKKIFNFIKDTVIKGIVITVPVAILIYIFLDSIKKLIEITTPLTNKMSLGIPIMQSIVAAIIVGLIVISVLFLFGILFYSPIGKPIVNWVENNFLMKVPMYVTLKGITKQVTKIEHKNYPIAEIDLFGNNTKVFGLVTEKLDNERSLVYVPNSPLVNIGQVYIVTIKDITILNSKVKTTLESLSKIGFEGKKIYEEHIQKQKPQN